MNSLLVGMETYYGQIKNPQDAVLLFEAARTGLAPRVQRRLSEKERQQIRSGSVFVWDEREAGMRRWTDGKSWSASRVSGSFLTYREMEGKRGGNGLSTSTSGRKSASGTKDSDGKDSDPEQNDEGPDGYRYKPDGLMKQSFSISTHDGRNMHLISYYARSMTNSNQLRCPSADPNFRAVRPPKGMYPESTINEAAVMPQGPRGALTPAPYPPQPLAGYYPHSPGYAYAAYQHPVGHHFVSPVSTPPAGAYAHSPPGHPPPHGYWVQGPPPPHYYPHPPPGYAHGPPRPVAYGPLAPHPGSFTSFDRAPPAPQQSGLPPPLNLEQANAQNGDRNGHGASLKSPNGSGYPQLSGGSTHMDKNRFISRPEQSTSSSSSHSRQNSGGKLDKPPTPPASNKVTPEKDGSESVLPPLQHHASAQGSRQLPELLAPPAHLARSASSAESSNNKIPSISSMLSGLPDRVTLPPAPSAMATSGPLTPVHAEHRPVSRSPLPHQQSLPGHANPAAANAGTRSPGSTPHRQLPPLRDSVNMQGQNMLNKLNTQFLKP